MSEPRFSIAVTMTKDIPNGMNILTRLNIWQAASIDEAVGRAVLEAQETNPGHRIFTIAKMVVPDAPCDSGRLPEGGDGTAPCEASQSGAEGNRPTSTGDHP